MRWTANVERMGKEECIEVISGKARRKETLRRLRRRWVHNAEIDLGETGWTGMD
jgi:hypothetical protein